MAIERIIIMVCVAASLIYAASAIPGTATYYTAPYVPSTCFGNQDQGVMIAAANDAIWDNISACGISYNVRCTGGVSQSCKDASVTVRIVDRCSSPGCASTMDLSQEAFSIIADINAGIINIDYSSVTSLGDYPSANLSTSWITDDQFWSFNDGSLLKPVLINNGKKLLDFPSVGCGFYYNTSGYGENSISFVIFAVMTTGGGSIFTMTRLPKIVWTANRANPVKKGATLQLTSEGDLVLRDAGGNLAWSTKTSGKSVFGMNITLAGNLILYDSNNSIIWQSFDHPTDTWLPGQRLYSGQRLIASVSTTNLTAGLLYLSYSSAGLFAFVEANPPQMYHKVFSGDTKSMQFKTGKLDVIHGESNSTMVLYVSNETDSFQYMRLGSDGHLRVYQWVQWWVSVADEIFNGSLGDCDYPTVCGNYGICTRGQCSCPSRNAGDPSYFRQLSVQQPSLGCIEVTQLSCRSPHLHHLLELENVSYFEFVTVMANTDVESCKEACLTNCSCKAAVYRYNSDNSRGNCSMPSQIFSLMNTQQQRVSYNSSTFIKVQSPDSQIAPESPPASSRKKKIQIALITGLIFAASFVFTLLILIYVRVNRKRKLLHERQEEDGEWENSLELLLDLPKRFGYEELKSATENFQVQKRLGGGGFGSVFEGTLGDGTRVAVKRLDRVGQGRKEFLAEVKTMGNIHHVNLVKLMGFCADRSHRLLVYEYMSNGSLDKWIFCRTSETALEWSVRKKIILNIAKGLAYLHEECKKRIVHLDIKPQNILLDDNFNAKLSDFGLAKFIDKDQSHVMTQMRGTRGYLAPEWLSRKITEKADVYSFGVVMLEVVCGRKNLDYSQPEESEQHLLQILKKKVEANQLADLIDKCSEDMHRHKDEAVEMMRTAIWCLYLDPAIRPSMSNVIKVLEGVAVVEHFSDFSFLLSTTIATPAEDVRIASTPPQASILSGPR